MIFISRSIASLLILFLLSSCSSVKILHSQNQQRPSGNKVNPDRVDFNLSESKKEAPVEIAPQEETVRVGDRGGDHYNTDTEMNPSQAIVKKLRIGLSFGPGIYRTINYVSVLKVLERQNLSPDIITGTGFGAIVAAMYAVGMTPEVIEWNFYKYFKEKKKNKIFEQEWIADVDKYLLMKFKSINIEDAKKKFYITLYDHKTRKTYYFDKGNIRDLLLLNLRLSTNAIKSKGGQMYSAAFENEVFNDHLLRQLGAEFTIAIDSLGTKVDFDNANEFLFGVYGKTAGRVQKENKKFDYAVSLPLQTMNLDSIKDRPLFLQKSYDFMQKQLPILFKKVQEKRDNIINLGNE